ncbi:MAG: S1 RNA-binding domain-containing protein, partial [Pauljensenia sp.]
VYIASADGASAEAARTMVNQIANPQMPEVGERFVGTVVKTTSFGAFVSLTPGKDGLLHISQVRRLVGGKRIDSVDDVLQVGQQVEVEINEIGDRGKLSLHAVIDGEAGELEASEGEQSERRERRDRSERRERRPRTRTRRRRDEDREDGVSEE